MHITEMHKTKRPCNFPFDGTARAVGGGTTCQGDENVCGNEGCYVVEGYVLYIITNLYCNGISIRPLALLKLHNIKDLLLSFGIFRS